MMTARPLALWALGLLANPVRATQWTVTSYYAVKATTSVWTEFSDTYTDTETFGLKDSATPTVTTGFSTSTSTISYDDLEVVKVYLDADDVDEDDMMTTTTYRDYSDYATQPLTVYVQPIEYTAPSSCPTPFTVKTYTEIDVPSEVEDQLTPTSTTTSVYSGSGHTYVTAFLSSGAASMTVDSASNFDYTYYVANCRNPTASGGAYFGPGHGDDYDDDDGGSYNCLGDSYCAPLAIYAIVLAALLPALFLLGFLESYFWFRRMMIGKFALRFGTGLWILLLWPVLCFTKQCPARDAQTQEALRQQWEKVSFGTAIGLWFRWGFRHRYPVELLGVHPQYHNPAPGTVPMGQGPPGTMAPGALSSGGNVYYAPGPAPGGQQMFQQGPPAYDSKAIPGQPGGPEQPAMGAPPPGMVMYYPQYPQQAYAPQQPQQAYAPQQPQQAYAYAPQQPQQAQQHPGTSTSPLSQSAPSDVPLSTASPQTSNPPQELLSSQPSHNGNQPQGHQELDSYTGNRGDQTQGHVGSSGPQ